ncbi:PRD domain-containing protein [Paenibacillus sp. 1011MAR3C5]|uniref:BglG family transcription antiterminator n=1 Tax=Paenibacillus sp. 1011MAR3C5 TaxID=1675787 RepID=UPI000E6CD9DD|nr:BglG family transcription antiterminator [Paenibacillus sp. 1011MAR3C5]RJE90386.1 PRD domain-containing protein [Paenibacillus sp. 1011MAR3C5]
MKVSNRQRKILELLLSRQDDTTAEQLGQTIGISSRTVHRELQILDPVLAGYDIALVKKSGSGIKLMSDPRSLSVFQEQLRKSDTETYSPEERKVLILCQLLSLDEPIKLFSLASEVQAAIPTVSRDLEELETSLTNSGLALVRRRGYGIEITGEETDRRNFIVKLAEEYIDDFLGALSRKEIWPTTHELLKLVGHEALFSVERTLWQLDEIWVRRLREADYNRLLVRLSVAFIRIQKGHLISSAAQLSSVQLSEESKQKLNALASSLGIDEMPDEELRYMQSLIDQAKEKERRSASALLEQYGLGLAERAISLIRLMEEETGTPFHKDRTLLEGLISHLGHALERLHQGETIRNPLLAQIKNDYESLLESTIRSAAKAWQDIAVPEEEAGYLAMHFGAAIERWKLVPRQVRALLVCTSGIGSSKLLAVRIVKEVPQVELLGHYSWYEASRMPSEKYDLIISTVDLPIEQDRYIKLSPLLTKDEAERLRSHIRELPVSPEIADEKDDKQDAWQRLNLLNRYAMETVMILESFHVYELDGGRSPMLDGLLKDALPLMLQEDERQYTNAIANLLIQREQQGSVFIPDTSLAMFHTRSELVTKPLITLFRLQKPFLLNEQEHQFVTQFLIMLAPAGLNQISLELLSEISAMLLHPEMNQLLNEGVTEKIRSFMSRQLEIYMKSKLEWREPS